MDFVKNLRLFPYFILMQNRAIKKMSFNVLKQKEAEFKIGQHYGIAPVDTRR